MPRLIDADALFKNNCIIVRGEDGEIVAQQMIEILRKAPTVDAVEVVYCGECRHADDECDNGWLWCNEWQCGSNCGGYCHKGQRREKGDGC